jgi:hypothetical protein
MSRLVLVASLLVLAQLVSAASAQIWVPQPYEAPPLQYGVPTDAPQLYGGPQPYGPMQPYILAQPYGPPLPYGTRAPGTAMPGAPWIYSSPLMYGSAPGFPSAYGGAPFTTYGDSQLTSPPMPGAYPAPGVWIWPPHGASFWPAPPYEIVLPDEGQTQPLTPGVPPQSRLPGFVPRLNVPMPQVPTVPSPRRSRPNEPPLSQ